ncbi:hypothetical protein [Candidatus Corynebacterium faecigallinarum]|uniref:hypothetical protein n=1 Tax=Candidatus Corynebacterium faecigallinarum TaxID=2838528 RepID=UPI003FD18F32
MTIPPLVVADYRADRLYSVEGTTVAPLGAGTPAEHAGILPLPAPANASTRWAFVDDRRGTLAIHTGGPEGAAEQVAVAIPGEHAASGADGKYVVVTTGLGANAEAWSDVITLVDTDQGESVRFRTRAGEPGVVMTTDRSTGEQVIVLRHREPGAIEAIRLADALTTGPHVPVVTGRVTTEIADDGHGDVLDSRHGIVATATSRGLERFIVEDGAPRPVGIIAWPATGRAFYLRFDAPTNRAVGVVRGGPTSPTAWTEWTNHLVDVDLATGDTRHAPLPDGLAFRFAIGGETTAVVTIHPDGDRLTLLHRTSHGLGVQRQVPLPPMSHPPVPGRLPWDPVGDSPAQRRAVAVNPTGQTTAVTGGGDGELHLVTDGGIETLTLPTDLDEGGVLYWPGGPIDPIGR